MRCPHLLFTLTYTLIACLVPAIYAVQPILSHTHDCLMTRQLQLGFPPIAESNENDQFTGFAVAVLLLQLFLADQPACEASRNLIEMFRFRVFALQYRRYFSIRY